VKPGLSFAAGRYQTLLESVSRAGAVCSLCKFPNGSLIMSVVAAHKVFVQAACKKRLRFDELSEKCAVAGVK